MLEDKNGPKLEFQHKTSSCTNATTKLGFVFIVFSGDNLNITKLQAVFAHFVVP